jgi:hypothetical protein
MRPNRFLYVYLSSHTLNRYRVRYSVGLPAFRAEVRDSTVKHRATTIFQILSYRLVIVFQTHKMICKFESLNFIINNLPIPVAVRSKAWTVFARLNTGIVGLNPTEGMDVCLRLFCVYVVLCRYRPCDGLISRPRSPIDCLRVKNLKWNKVFNGCRMLQIWSNRKEI